jgi:hypothetical protein
LYWLSGAALSTSESVGWFAVPVPTAALVPVGRVAVVAAGLAAVTLEPLVAVAPVVAGAAPPQATTTEVMSASAARFPSTIAL